MRRLSFIPTLAALLLVGAGCAPVPSSTPEAAAPARSIPEAAMEQGLVISVDENGFSPATLTVKKGAEVYFKNAGTKSHWPASAVHPIHSDLPGFDALGAVKPGDSYDFTFTKVGTWKYHDHLNPSRTGSVTVTE